jgi:SAM-dependent methyltransferase
MVRGLIPAARDLQRIVARLILNLGRNASKEETPGVRKSSGRLDPFPFDMNQAGDSRRLVPVSRTFGFDRGTPVDRYYIERFLAENAGDIRGRVLEVGDNAYTLRFGGARVGQSDILHVDATNPRATFVGDLARRDVLPEGVFDCIILTQTLQFIFDMHGAVATLYRSLKPGGTLLLTAPGISPVDRGEWGAIWYWSITAVGARRLLEEQFPSDAITVGAYGNVFAATAFLYGLALEELELADLNVDDASFPVTVAARAVKARHP